MSTTFHGKPDVSCFNRMGVDAVTIGNHEFDFGLANFKQLQEQATFPSSAPTSYSGKTAAAWHPPMSRFRLPMTSA
jgi:2',3'-cyclic-nucleotide 2'-phosphodiesterase (5'-nucleotidase family)